MSEQKPKTKDWLGENVQHGICDNLLVDADDVTALRKTEDAIMGQWCAKVTMAE